jgi:hypothetical protein
LPKVTENATITEMKRDAIQKISVAVVRALYKHLGSLSNGDGDTYNGQIAIHVHMKQDEAKVVEIGGRQFRVCDLVMSTPEPESCMERV